MATERPSLGLTERLQAALKERGQRWTEQRQIIVEVLAASDGHATGAELVERVREQDPSATPSTVYRTLDLLEELGLARHHHGPDGRETYHLEETVEHAHLHCRGCGAEQEMDAAVAAPILKAIATATGFSADLDHLSMHGLCRRCAAARGPSSPRAKAGE
ncbi:MAG: Fur family transcriptional regulator [Candidatus Limnocylindrus sp.]|jgi:Fur family ferric uptake transcriptional regulator